MIRPQRLGDVGAPDLEARNSPIMEEGDEEFELLALGLEERACCYFNNVAYDHGAFVCSDSGEQLGCE